MSNTLTQKTAAILEVLRADASGEFMLPAHVVEKTDPALFEKRTAAAVQSGLTSLVKKGYAEKSDVEVQTLIKGLTDMNGNPVEAYESKVLKGYRVTDEGRSAEVLIKA